MDLRSLLLGLILGGGGLKIIELLIMGAKERRYQKSAKTAKEKDRPRFRVDAAIDESTRTTRPTIVVKILSLGGLPLTINDGYIEVKSSHYEKIVHTRQLRRREISPIAPIEEKIPVTIYFLQGEGATKTEVTLICKFSYGENERYENEWRYNPQSRRFEPGH